MTRRCARPACGKPAGATLTYDYGSASVWLDVLSDERVGLAGQLDLCDAHAESTTPPSGWKLVDRRPSPLAPRVARETPTRRAPARRPVIASEAVAVPLSWPRRTGPASDAVAALEAGSPMLARAFRAARVS